VEPTTSTERPPQEISADVGVSEIIERQLLRTLFQPIVNLRSNEIVGYEALIRGPEGSPFESPGALFAAGAAVGLDLELDWACTATALRAALSARVHPTRAVFINVQPESLTRPTPEWLAEIIAVARRRLTIVLEISERGLTGAPASLLAATARLRSQGALLALDDVGSDPRSLSLLPFVDPEVVKLDLDVTQSRAMDLSARMAAAVHAHAERSGARVLAEGIETPEHRDTALALGADLGQGWLFGRPGQLPVEAAEPISSPVLVARPLDLRSAETPFKILSSQIPVRPGTKELLVRMSRLIEAQVEAEDEAVVLLSSFQEAQYFGPATRARYRRISEQAGLVAALGVGLDATPEPGIRGAAPWRVEPLRGEWNVCAVGPYFAAAFVAHDMGDDGPDKDRRFDFIMTHDRDLVIAAARALMVRLAEDSNGGESSS
jgi:EAL domain-containing protein (putative c-di-GMP-specific phosphodiesterase class I)